MGKLEVEYEDGEEFDGRIKRAVNLLIGGSPNSTCSEGHYKIKIIVKEIKDGR